MNAPLDPITHHVRVSALENETIWRLGPDALEREEIIAGGIGATVRYPYADIRGLRLSFAPSRADGGRYRCDLQLKQGTLAAIVSTHYAGVGNFEDRSATYGPLVRGLVARVAAANPACEFRAGKHAPAYWGEHIFLLAMIVVLGLRDRGGRRLEPAGDRHPQARHPGRVYSADDHVYAQELAAALRSFGHSGRSGAGRSLTAVVDRFQAVTRKRSTAASSTSMPSPGLAGNATMPSLIVGVARTISAAR